MASAYNPNDRGSASPSAADKGISVVAGTEPGPASMDPQSLSGPMPSQGVVAIVDDDQHIAQALCDWLESLGLHGCSHLTGESLLQSLREEYGQWILPADVAHPVARHLIGAVLDLNLPGISGFELAVALRRSVPGLPLVIITALREDERIRYGAAPPGVCCLKKPFDLNALEEALLPPLRPSMPGPSIP